MNAERAAQKKTKPLSLPMKDISKIVVLLGIVVSAIVSAVAWMHAEVTVPKILQQTSIQIQEAIENHSGFPHPVSASRREFEMLSGKRKAPEESPSTLTAFLIFGFLLKVKLLLMVMLGRSHEAITGWAFNWVVRLLFLWNPAFRPAKFFRSPSNNLPIVVESP